MSTQFSENKHKDSRHVVQPLLSTDFITRIIRIALKFSVIYLLLNPKGFPLTVHFLRLIRSITRLYSVFRLSIERGTVRSLKMKKHNKANRKLLLVVLVKMKHS